MNFSSTCKRFGDGWAGWFGLEQNGVFYYGGAEYFLTDANWITWNSGVLKAADFIRYLGSGEGPDHPDFSVSGKPIRSPKDSPPNSRFTR